MAKVIGDAADAIALENWKVDLVGGWKIIGLPSFHVCIGDACG